MTIHNIDFRIYYEDTDAGGVVYHARYLAFAERARTEAIRSEGMSAMDLLNDHGLLFVVRNATLDYRRPLRLDDVFTVRTRLKAQAAATCHLVQDFIKDDTICVHTDVRLACIRAADGRPARFPPSWRALLARLEE
ncbi:tol-pal system-associated acyl-CoA thioesterase [Acetobacter sp.]|jgi:acyl-CoA thioester hydrolase|uniref:tol-pal system-associated acyl-CoA thioesterase n=1 Tax=Acetobacter sp. TaxID=440 RepID=UPI0025B90871|nr:tol-pal system-associated acyl-CoA thioesterase [Acetobacter sp.]MCH4090258.1 tol-pal system-associated acyl-CoA thioesterase [Acetobacter sp.]MCI1298952.1 tol-pal system-associated acyl-CoA thioesterase [Acetobacter sp.]MCI1314972.1 tol-pal system-associated acyl-CoA thioesterase [Acetobacter sp.]